MSAFVELTNGRSLEDGETILEILGFWFGRDEVLKLNKPTFSYYDDLWRKKWFAKSAQQSIMDKYIAEKYTVLIEQMKEGERDYWRDSPYGLMAAIIVLDQFTRNVHRDKKEAWSGDSKALEFCLEGINNGLYNKLSYIMRAEYLMPLVHAEDIEMQTISKQMYSQLLDEVITHQPAIKMMFQRFVKISEVHYNSVLLFGRFPERNRYLCRRTTPEEKNIFK
eukprot:TRINITY_DN4228_c0_g1_i1.p1 TRINITY_DN4228_c0_g1~~TRINITY_DN4228_c0_g1_i1.p1  ORF type:complete len:222 (-),score=42.56 TRINITY_DN4228_c0_g1_i1:139-804(-)